MNKSNVVIGVVGTFASGKDTVAAYLANRGYNHVSSGDVLRRYIVDNNLGSLERDNLRLVANKTRAEKGADFFVRDAVEKWPRPLVVSGLRSSGEVEAIKREKGVIIAVDAPVTRRYNWAKARQRIDDNITEEKFKDQELAEESDKPTDCQISVVMSMADFNISNDGSLEQLHGQIDDVLLRITPRPAPGSYGYSSFGPEKNE